MTPVTQRQRETMRDVTRVYPAWYRAAGNGQRVVLANLFYAGVLERRIWRGVGPDAAHEYRPSPAWLAIVKQNKEIPT